MANTVMRFPDSFRSQALWLCVFLSVTLSNAFQPVLPTSTKFFQSTRNTALSGIVEFVEPETGVTVRLIGAMHYNPASIRLTAESLQELQAQDRLGSVLIESCPSRWDSTLDNDLPDIVTRLLMSEMRTAHDLALNYGRPVILADQPIEVTVDRCQQNLADSVRALLTPRQWPDLVANFTTAWSLAVPFGPQYLGPRALLDPKLVLAAPVSLFKYPLSYMVRDPVTAIIFLGTIWGADVASAAALGQPTTVLDETVQFFVDPSLWTYDLSDAVLDVFGTAVEAIVFGGLFLQVLLVERNRVLARNILQQCRYYQSFSKSTKQSQLWDWWPLWNTRRRSNSDIPYAEQSPRLSPTGSDKAVVVAVLGMAHVNGIRKLLEEQQVQE